MSGAVLKYITVRRTSDRMKHFETDALREESMSFDEKLKNNSKKCLTSYRESDKMNKLSAERLRRTGP